MPFDGTPFAAQAAPAWSDCAHPMMYVSNLPPQGNGMDLNTVKTSSTNRTRTFFNCTLETVLTGDTGLLPLC